MRIDCPHCGIGIGGPSREGGLRVRVTTVLVDPKTGDVTGPCPDCKGSIVLVNGGRLGEALVPRDEPKGRRRVVVVPAIPLPREG